MKELENICLIISKIYDQIIYYINKIQNNNSLLSNNEIKVINMVLFAPIIWENDDDSILNISNNFKDKNYLF